MTRRLDTWLLAFVVLVGCQPKDRCDPGWEARDNLCVEIAPQDGSGGEDTTADAGPGPDAGGGRVIPECRAGDGDPSTFGQTCATDADCGCPAPICLPMLFICSHVGCDDVPERCPDGYSCAEIPAAFQQDGITHVCLPGG